MIKITKQSDIEKNYEYMLKTIESFLEDETDIIANLSNISAVINEYIEDLNWCGFYFLKDNDLVLGPFQGKPACIRIKPGKGVCFAAIQKGSILNVPDVEDFPSHIACDSDTKSELVSPIYKNGVVYGVLDLDSPKLNRFTNTESHYINLVCEKISKFL